MAKKYNGITISVRYLGASKALQTRMNRFIRDRGFLDEIADTVELHFREKPLAGRNFPAISDLWAEKREYLRRFNKVHRDYSLGRSNLTFTGALLESITATVKIRESLIVVCPEGRHPGYRGASGGNTRRRSAQNIDIAKGQKAMGRNIMTIPKRLEKEILKVIKSRLKRQFKG